MPENVVYKCCVLVSYLENILSIGITASPVPPVLFQEAKGGQEEANPKQRSCLNNITKQNNKNNISVLIFSEQKYFEADNVKKSSYLLSVCSGDGIAARILYVETEK